MDLIHSIDKVFFNRNEKILRKFQLSGTELRSYPPNSDPHTGILLIPTGCCRLFAATLDVQPFLEGTRPCFHTRLPRPPLQHLVRRRTAGG